MSGLPKWCDTPEARRLLDAVLAERPSYRVTQGAWIEGGGNVRYLGKNAGALRRYHNALLQDALRRDDADYYSTGAMGTRFSELMEEAPDRLIARLLSREPIDFDDGPKDCPKCGTDLEDGKCGVGCDPSDTLEPARHVLTDRVTRRAA